MTKINKLFIILLASAGCIQLALAEESDQKLQINANLYGDFYNYDFTRGAGGTNGFTLDQLDIFLHYNFSTNWGAEVMTGLGPILTSGTAVGEFHPYIKQAKVMGNNLWGDGSQLQFGQILNPHFVYLDVPLNTWWLGIYSMPMGDFLTQFFDTGVAASGKIGDLSYSAFIESGLPTVWRGAATIPTYNRNALAYEGIVKYQVIKQLAVMAEDTYWPGSSAGTLATSSDNYFEGSLLWLSEWVDAAIEAGHFRHSQASNINNFDLGGIGAVVPGTQKGPLSITSYEAQANLKLASAGFNGWTIYGRYQFGNQDFATYVGGYKNQFTAGPTYSWQEGKLGLGVLYDIAQPSSDALPSRQSLAVRMKAMF